MSRAVLHKGHARPNRYGGFNNNSLCGRTNRRAVGGMNIADADADVTCKFCLARMGAETSS